MKKKVYIRVDGSNEIGLGHLVRCLALAQILRKEFLVQFVIKEAPESICNYIKDKGFVLHKIMSESTFMSRISGECIVVLDNYFFDTGYQRDVKKKGAILVCIDDLCDKFFYADLIINQAPGIDPITYKAQCFTQYALGPAHALLRENFLELARSERFVDNIESVFICFGGADSLNLTTRALKIVASDRRFKKINVVTGVAFAWKREIETIASYDERVRYCQNIQEEAMRDILIASDLAIVPSSGIMLEAMAAGCRLISGMYVDNQRLVFEAYKREGVFESAEFFDKSDLVNAINKIFLSPSKISRLLDGHSDKRILKCFRQLCIDRKIFLRQARREDVSITFRWANDPAIRAFSFSKNTIGFEEHSQWFLDKIDTANCIYCIAEMDNMSIGSIRFDINDSEALISYLIDPKHHNQGLGIALLKHGSCFLQNVLKKEVVLTGYVDPLNIASLKAFEKLAYNKSKSDGVIKFTKKLNPINSEN